MSQSNTIKSKRQTRARILEETKPGLVFKKNPDYKRIVEEIKKEHRKEGR